MTTSAALLIMLAGALALALGGLGMSALLSPNRKNTTKLMNYECGIDPMKALVSDGRFPVKYYLVAMTFIVFDIEVVFLYPWAVSMTHLSLNLGIGMVALIAMMSFVVLLVIPYIYQWRRGGLDWW